MVDKSRGREPVGQTSRGTPRGQSTNPKNASARRRESIGSKGDGTGGLPVRGAQDDDTTWQGGNQPNAKNRGSASSIPDSSTVNPYVEPAGGSTPKTTVSSAKRSYSIDPGPQTLGSTSGVEGGEQRQTPRGGAD